jgi:hypothetical protein
MAMPVRSLAKMAPERIRALRARAARLLEQMDMGAKI